MTQRSKYFCFSCNIEVFISKRTQHERTQKHICKEGGIKDEWTCEECNITISSKGRTSHQNGRPHKLMLLKNNKPLPVNDFNITFPYKTVEINLMNTQDYGLNYLVTSPKETKGFLKHSILDETFQDVIKDVINKSISLIQIGLNIMLSCIVIL